MEGEAEALVLLFRELLFTKEANRLMTSGLWPASNINRFFFFIHTYLDLPATQPLPTKSSPSMITRHFFDRLFPSKGLDSRKYNLVRERDKLIECLNRILPKYGIDNYLRICAFFGNCGIETDYFKTTIEYASGADYEGRKNLGNYYPGDGKRFKGRGLSQTTGRFNYSELQKAIGGAMGIDVVKNPELLAQVEIAVESACVFWRDHDLNRWADAGEFKALSGIVNRGDRKKTPLHWPKRLALYKLCLVKVPKDFSLVPQAVPDPIRLSDVATQPIEPPADAATIPAAEASASMSLKDLSSKYLKHTPADSVKNVLLVLAGRIGSAATATWSLGFGGKVLMVLLIAAIVGPLIYAIYFYRWRFVGWVQTIVDSILGNG